MRKDVKERLNEYSDFYWKCGTVYETRSVPASRLLLESGKSDDSLHPCGLCFHSLNHPLNLTNAMRKMDSEYIILDEALIATYPLDKLVAKFKKFFLNEMDSTLVKLKMCDVLKHPPARHGQDRVVDWHLCSADSHIVEFILPYFVSDFVDWRELVEKLSRSMYVCGWNLDSADKVSDNRTLQPFNYDKIGILDLSFETRYSRLDLDLSENLFHVAPHRYFNKIRQRGLVPRSSKDLFNYPDRVYLFCHDDIERLKSYGKMKLSTSCFNKHTDEDGGFDIYKISRDNLLNHRLYKSGKMVFYVDSHYRGGLFPPNDEGVYQAIFTYNNIPPELLEDDTMHFEIGDDKQ